MLAMIVAGCGIGDYDFPLIGGWWMFSPSSSCNALIAPSGAATPEMSGWTVLEYGHDARYIWARCLPGCHGPTRYGTLWLVVDTSTGVVSSDATENDWRARLTSVGVANPSMNIPSHPLTKVVLGGGIAIVAIVALAVLGVLLVFRLRATRPPLRA